MLMAKISPESQDRLPTWCSIWNCVSFQDENSDSKPCLAEWEHRLHHFSSCSPEASALSAWRLYPARNPSSLGMEVAVGLKGCLLICLNSQLSESLC